jgi:hypothetical protein
MKMLLQTLESACLLRWAGFERHQVFTKALSLSKLHPPCIHGLCSVFVTNYMNNPGLRVLRNGA